jgi:hypothetical protein
VTTALEVAVVAVLELVAFVVVVLITVFTKSNLAVDEELIAKLGSAMDSSFPVSTDVLAADNY